MKFRRPRRQHDRRRLRQLLARPRGQPLVGQHRSVRFHEPQANRLAAGVDLSDLVGGRLRRHRPERRERVRHLSRRGTAARPSHRERRHEHDGERCRRHPPVYRTTPSRLAFPHPNGAPAGCRRFRRRSDACVNVAARRRVFCKKKMSLRRARALARRGRGFVNNPIRTRPIVTMEVRSAFVAPALARLVVCVAVTALACVPESIDAGDGPMFSTKADHQAVRREG